MHRRSAPESSRARLPCGGAPTRAPVRQVSAWAPAALPAALCATLLWLPGLVLGRLAGLRGTTWWGVAPVLSTGVLAVGAVLAAAAGVTWSPVVVVAGTAAGAVLAVPVGLLARSGRGERGDERWAAPGGRRGVASRVASRVAPRVAPRSRPGGRELAVGVAAVGGLAVGAALALRRLLRAIAGPHGVSQSFDAVFHLNAVRWVLERGDASSLTLGAMTTPGRTAAFYPGGWHAVVSLVAGTTGAAPDVATNACAVVVAVGVWPVAALALVRCLAGRAPVALAAAGALPVAFLAHPLLPLEWGVLYPTALAHALLPAVLATVVAAADRARPPRVRLSLLLVTAAQLPGLALAQPSAVFALAAITLPLGVALLVRWARAGAPAGTSVGSVGRGRTRVLGVAAACLLAVAGGWLVVDGSGFAASMRSTDWEAEATTGEALWQAVGGGYMNRPATPAVAAAVLVGAVVAWRRPRWRWLVVAHVLVSALYVLAWGVDSELSQVLTGFWYNDAFRIAGLPVITGLPLAALALDAAAATARRAARRGSGGRGRAGGEPAPRGLLARLGRPTQPVGGGARSAPRRARRAARPPAARVWGRVQVVGAALAVLAVVATARGDAVVTAYDQLAANYANGDPALSDMLDADERALIDRLPAVVPADVAVAGNPWNGSALVWALTGRPTPFPHLVNAFDAPRQVVADRLRDVVTDSAVCPALAQLRVGYVLDFGEGYLWGSDSSGRDDRYPGLVGLADRPGFALVDEQGRARLYRVTAC